MEFAIIIESGEQSGYVAHTIGIEWCITQGKTIAETCKNMGECIELHLEEASKKDKK
jgi:predicted RNase H-like HicB family nuclease